jgi:hypothetical protein
MVGIVRSKIQSNAIRLSIDRNWQICLVSEIAISYQIINHRNWVEEILKNGSNQRDAKWTESIAVGDKDFVIETKAKLGAKAIGRSKIETDEGYELREQQIPYTPVFAPEKSTLSTKNDYVWQIS